MAGDQPINEPTSSWIRPQWSDRFAQLEAAVEATRATGTTCSAVIVRDPQGRPVHVTDASGRAREFEYEEGLAPQSMRLTGSSDLWKSVAGGWQLFAFDGSATTGVAQGELLVTPNGEVVFFNWEDGPTKIYVERTDGTGCIFKVDQFETPRNAGKAAGDDLDTYLKKRTEIAGRARIWDSFFSLTVFAAIIAGLIYLGGIVGLSLAVTLAACTPLLLIYYGFDESGALEFFILFAGETVLTFLGSGALVMAHRSLNFGAAVMLVVLGIVNMRILLREDREQRRFSIGLEATCILVGLALVLKFWGAAP